MTTETNGSKPGAATTEFWASALAMIATLLTSATATDWRVQCTGLVCMTAVIACYTVARGWTKA